MLEELFAHTCLFHSCLRLKKEINLTSWLKNIWALKRLLPYSHYSDVNDDGNILERKLEKKQDDKVQVENGNYRMELQEQDGNIVTAMTLLMDSSTLCQHWEETFSHVISFNLDTKLVS